MFRFQVRMHPELDILVSSIGEVYLPKSGKNKSHWTFGSKQAKGYLSVSIDNKQYLVHRLVAETFIPNLENKKTVDHIDRDRHNNCVDNLHWATYSEQNKNTVRYINCASKYGVHPSENPAEYSRAWRKVNPEHNRKIAKEWRQAHLEHARKMARERWRRKHWENYEG